MAAREVFDCSVTTLHAGEAKAPLCEVCWAAGICGHGGQSGLGGLGGRFALRTVVESGG